MSAFLANAADLAQDARRLGAQGGFGRHDVRRNRNGFVLGPRRISDRRHSISCRSAMPKAKSVAPIPLANLIRLWVLASIGWPKKGTLGRERIAPLGATMQVVPDLNSYSKCFTQLLGGASKTLRSEDRSLQYRSVCRDQVSGAAGSGIPRPYPAAGLARPC